MLKDFSNFSFFFIHLHCRGVTADVSAVNTSTPEDPLENEMLHLQGFILALNFEIKINKTQTLAWLNTARAEELKCFL